MKTFIVCLTKVYEVTENDVLDRLYETKENPTKKNMKLAAEELAQEQFANDALDIDNLYDFTNPSTKILE